jgi:hypothetical protein
VLCDPLRGVVDPVGHAGWIPEGAGDRQRRFGERGTRSKDPIERRIP